MDPGDEKKDPKKNSKNDNSNKSDSGKKGAGNNQKNDTENPFAGFDFADLLDKHSGEILKHLLSGGGAVAITYFLFIKSLQEKLEALNSSHNEIKSQLSGLHKKFYRLEQEHKRLLDDISKEREMNEGYSWKKSNSQGHPRIIKM